MTKPLWSIEELQQALQISSNIGPTNFLNDHLNQNGCQIHGGQSLRSIHGISIDTRTLQPGDLFVAIKGPFQDGHQHIVHAQRQGAAAAIVERYVKDDSLSQDFCQIIVPDSYQALCDLARYARARVQNDCKIIGLTGSFGKTSSREALRHILQNLGPTYATDRNFNNHWGVPLTLARMPQQIRFAVLEMGMNHADEITPLTQLIQPHLSLITTIGNAHIGNFSSLDGIADAKAEIFTGMVSGGIAVLNKDNPQYPRLAAAAHQRHLQIVTFGRTAGADIRLTASTFSDHRLHMTIDAAGQQLNFDMNVLGDHWGMNMTGVIACIYALNLDVHHAAQALTTFLPLSGRGQVIKVSYQNQPVQIIDDTYNGGPQAMHAALQMLGRLVPGTGGRRIAVLGDMGDLGEHAPAEHKALYTSVVDNRIDKAYLFGPQMHHLHNSLPDDLPSHHFATISDLIAAVESDLHGGDCILVKGGHGQWAYDGVMQQVVTSLIAFTHKP